jgi:HD-GYP domain-containing protein (c-di-GMP phosphodiesterase class II)
MKAAGASPDSNAANTLITVVACTASVSIAYAAPHDWPKLGNHWGVVGAFALVTLALQLLSVPVYERGGYSFSGSGMLALGFMFGAGAAMVVGAAMGIVNLVRRRGRLNRGIFDASQWALAAGAGAATYSVLDPGGSLLARLPAAIAASIAFFVVNIGLLVGAMSISEGRDPRQVFLERFRWIIPYHLASGPLAIALVIADEKMGTIGLFAFAAPPAAMMFSVQQYLAKTRRSVEEVRLANDELRRAIGELEERNSDLKDLLDFAAGLAARAHDRHKLTAYAREVLRRVVGSAVEISDDPNGPIPLVAAGARVGSVALADPSPGVRWERLREVMLPHLATALESTRLVDEVRRRHLSTIAALSRSMEAKDYYTGGHTERVAEISVALARRFGFEGEELDAIEIGALLHDIGKIGIPEQVLHKPGPLDDEEWRLMREHPVLSDYILSDLDLHSSVREIARSSHERIDGGGYPDGLKGDQIPLTARIVLVADALDALTTDRPYRRARPIPAALEEIRAHSGTQFCPTVVSALEDLWREHPEVLGAGRLQVVAAG